MVEIDMRSCRPGACVEVSGKTSGECTNISSAIQSIRTSSTARIPVGLAQLTVQVNMDSKITLPEPATEIKNIKKRVIVTQCRLLQPTNNLFIKGFVRKDISYATRQCSNVDGVCGDIRHCTVDVPFRCTTTVNFNGMLPVNNSTNTSSQFEYLRKMGLPASKFAEKDKLLSGDLSQFNHVFSEFFNEPPFCKLVNARIIEYDEYLDSTRILVVSPFGESEFRKIEEKTVIFLTLKILQGRNVSIP